MAYLEPSFSSSVPPHNGSQELDELTKFRNDWKQELGLHGRAEATYKSSFSPEEGLPVSQQYSAEELPQAQDSFVCLWNIRCLGCLVILTFM